MWMRPAIKPIAMRREKTKHSFFSKMDHSRSFWLFSVISLFAFSWQLTGWPR
jgi:hypothetical protein